MSENEQVFSVRIIRYELRRRELEVVRAERISPNFMAVTFGGDSLADFVSGSFDDHVKFMFARADGREVRRDYTPRRFDPVAGELTLEMGLRGDGAAVEWARNAAPGQRVLIGGPKGSMIIPVEYGWHFLIGDATALPAIHRRLEELPESAKAIVRLYVADVRDRRNFEVRAKADIEWADSPEELLEGVRNAELPEGRGFTWAAGESALMAAVKGILCDEKGVDRETMRIGVYWKQGSSDFHESLAKPSAEPV